MKLEISIESAGKTSLRLVPEGDLETEQLRVLKEFGIDSKVSRVEFAVPRRRRSEADQEGATQQTLME